MAQLFAIHPIHPQARLIERAAEFLRDGAVVGYPTDSCYALGCRLGDKDAVNRLRRIRQISDKHPLTIVCASLSQVTEFARVDDNQYRILKRMLPGGYTFILQATRAMPKGALDSRRKTIGVRIPANLIAKALLDAHGAPIISATAILPGEQEAVADASVLRERLQRDIEVVVDGGECGVTPTTLIDLSGPEAIVLRMGAGPIGADWMSDGA